MIINEGLTEDVVVYAAGDVEHLENIRDAQLKELDNQKLTKACEFECEATKFVAYAKYCGIHLNAERWKNKMKKDLIKLKEAERLGDFLDNTKAAQRVVQGELLGNM